MKFTNRLFPLLTMLLAANVAFAFDFEADGVYYNITSHADLTCEVTCNEKPSDEVYPDGTAYSGIISIPSHVTYNEVSYTVTGVGDNAFAMCDGLTFVVLPQGVTYLGENAFYGCNNLQSLILPEGLTTIGDFAFRDCYYLNPLTLPSTVISIGSSAFSYCTTLTSITLPTGVTTISNYAFHGCMFLHDVVLHDGITHLGQNAFSECTQLQRIDLPNQLVEIGRSAFADCTQLSQIQIPSSVEVIGNHAFRDCGALQSITIPAQVSIIGDYTFSGCYSLANVKFSPQGLQQIGERAFSYCNALQYIDLPSTLIAIGEGAFVECESLMDVVLPDGLDCIADNTFAYCYGLRSVCIPRSVHHIGTGAFLDCNSLTSVLNNATRPQDIDQHTFNHYGHLHVIEDHSIFFKQAPYWSDFNIIDDLPYIRVEQIRLWQEQVQCQPGQVMQAYAECLPLDAIYTEVEWSSSNTAVVYVDKTTGQFVAIKSGTATLTASATDDSQTQGSVLITVGDGGETSPIPSLSCHEPTIAYSHGQLEFYSPTVGAEYHCTITDADTMHNIRTGSNVKLSGALYIEVYATAPGYLPSPMVCTTLYWLNATAQSSVPHLLAERRPVFCSVNNGVISLSGLDSYETVEFYLLKGQYIGTCTATDGSLSYDLSSYIGQIVLTKIDGQDLKILISQ